jgi:ribosomal protein S18 acetylase RimI-like enzyme
MQAETDRGTFRNTGLEHRKNLFSRLFFKRRFIVRYSPNSSMSPDSSVKVIRDESELDTFRRALDPSEFSRLSRYLRSECTVYLCVEDGSVVGVATTHHPKAREVWFDSLPTRPGEARICSLFVSPAHRGLGVAARLRKTLLNDMTSQGRTRIWSVVEATNHLVRRSVAAFDPNQERIMKPNLLVKLFGINIISLAEGKVYLLIGRRRNKL